VDDPDGRLLVWISGCRSPVLGRVLWWRLWWVVVEGARLRGLKYGIRHGGFRQSQSRVLWIQRWGREMDLERRVFVLLEEEDFVRDLGIEGVFVVG